MGKKQNRLCNTEEYKRMEMLRKNRLINLGEF